MRKVRWEDCGREGKKESENLQEGLGLGTDIYYFCWGVGAVGRKGCLCVGGRRRKGVRRGG